MIIYEYLNFVHLNGLILPASFYSPAFDALSMHPVSFLFVLLVYLLFFVLALHCNRTPRGTNADSQLPLSNDITSFSANHFGGGPVTFLDGSLKSTR